MSMRTIIELPNDLLKTLDQVAKGRSLSRAEIIRRAITLYLKQEAPTMEQKDAFGLWRGRDLDALVYEDSLRAEWGSEVEKHRTRTGSPKPP